MTAHMHKLLNHDRIKINYKNFFKRKFYHFNKNQKEMF